MRSGFSSIEEVWSFLDQVPMFGHQGASAANFSLRNILEACHRLGDPQKAFPSIHVAGTNGKGTTCHLLEHLYSEAGYRTGMFTSPHLLRYNERVRIAGESISDDLILQFFRLAEEILKDTSLTYFEISTAMAFWAFKELQVDLAIIETGLGGRLDATNIIDPELSIITSIGLDHQDILGNTLKEIAREKAGIIKPGKPVILGNVDEELVSVFSERAASTSSRLIKSVDANPTWDQGTVMLRGLEIPTRFIEPVNIWNVACTVLAVEQLQSKFPVNEDQLVSALRTFKGAPGRFEKLHPEKEWYFSGSHNAQALESTLEALNSFSERPVLIISMLKDKLTEPVYKLLNEAQVGYFYSQGTHRSASAEDVANIKNLKEINQHNKKDILKELESSLVIFTGSFYFYTTVKRWMEEISH